MEDSTPKVTPLKFVWLDAYEGDSDWFDYGDYDPEDRLMVTYGYPFATNRNYVAVASTFDPAGDNYAVIINIPWGMLREVTSIEPQVDSQETEPTDPETLRRTIQRYRQQKD